MTWDPVWETVYRSRAWGQYPGEDVIRFVQGIDGSETGVRLTQERLDRECPRWECAEGHLKGFGATRFTSEEQVTALLKAWSVDRSSLTEENGKHEIRHLSIYGSKP
jgi:hypothetical protein